MFEIFTYLSDNVMEIEETTFESKYKVWFIFKSGKKRLLNKKKTVIFTQLKKLYLECIRKEAEIEGEYIPKLLKYSKLLKSRK